MKTKKIIALLAVLVILFAGIYAVKYGYDNYQVTNVDVTVNPLAAEGSLQDQADAGYIYSKDGEEIYLPEGVADEIIQKNVTERNSANDVASIVFDFRGYDTIGEALILSTAICGSFVILSKAKKNKEEQA